jgi:hypothetical protein
VWHDAHSEAHKRSLVKAGLSVEENDVSVFKVTLDDLADFK